MSIKSTLSLLLFALLAVACRDSTTFDLPTSPPLPVLNAVLMAGEIPEVYVGTSWNATGPIPANAFSTDAIVTLFENDSLLGTLSHTGKGMYRLPSVRLKAGRRYVFKVSTPNGTEAENQPVMVPMDPPVQRVWLDREAVVSGLNGTRNKPILLRVHLRDDLRQERYYGVAIDNFWRGYPVSSNITPVEVSNTSLQYRDDDCFRYVGLEGDFSLVPLQRKTGMLVYGNSCFATQEKELGIVVETFGTVQSPPPSTNEQADDIKVQVLSLSPEYYQYAKTSKILEGLENAFVEPSRTYTNVKGGYGVVAAVNRKVYRVVP